MTTAATQDAPKAERFGKLPVRILEDERLTLAGRCLLMAMASFGWESGGGVCFASVDSLRKRSGVSRRQIQKLLPELEKLGFIRCEHDAELLTGRRFRLLWIAKPEEEGGALAAPLEAPKGRTPRQEGAHSMPGAFGRTGCAEMRWEEERETTTKRPAPESSLSSSLDPESNPEKPPEPNPLAAAIAKVREAFPDEKPATVVKNVRSAAGRIGSVAGDDAGDWIIQAVEIAQKAGKDWGFIRGTLNNWLADGAPSIRGKAKAAAPPAPTPAWLEREPLALEIVLPHLDDDEARETLKALPPARQELPLRMASYAMQWDPLRPRNRWVMEVWNDLHVRLGKTRETELVASQPAPTTPCVTVPVESVKPDTRRRVDQGHGLRPVSEIVSIPMVASA